MKSIMRPRTAISLLSVLVIWHRAAAGQTPAARVAITAQAIAVFHRVAPVAEGRTASAFQLTQPMITAAVGMGRGLGARITVNLEGLTMPEGELTPGAWGEGFVDRRHPHTYWHELMLDGVHRFPCGRTARCHVGVFLGKGFVPFGSADPMTRPFVRYPVNHHLAQILERAVAGAQVAVGPALLEGSVFNGDEPERPGQWPRIRGRFADSWSLRATLRHHTAVELAVSMASVASPEHRDGAGSDHRKRHLGVTLRPPGPVTIFGEWGRSSEFGGFFVFDTWLAEAVWRSRRVQIQYRIEATDRPEEERFSSFRSARPHLDNSVLGISRWTSHTLGATVPVRRFLGQGCVVGFGEATAGRMRSVAGGTFDVVATYGRSTFSSVSAGIKVGWGSHHSSHRCA